jgi:hypothetical protein
VRAAVAAAGGSGAVVAVVAVCLGWTGFGCDGESSFVIPRWDAGAVGMGHAAACGAWAQSVCDYEERCPPPISVRSTDHAHCTQRAALGCELVAQDPGVVFDDDTVAGCTYPADCTAPPPPYACLPPGRTPEGGRCVFQSACASGYCSISTDSTGHIVGCGVCKLFMKCSPACASDQICLRGDGGLRCVDVPGAGETCDSTDDYFCRASLCSVGPGGGTGVCQPLAELGEPCQLTPPGPLCDGPDIYCDKTSHCAPVTAAGYGEPCGVDDAGAFRTCTGYGQCDYNATGLCVSPAPDGALCDNSQGLVCQPPAECWQHHCVYPSMALCPGAAP